MTKQDKNKSRIRAWFKEYKARLVCKCCPEKHFACLEFHHEDEDKFKSIGRMVGEGYSIARLLEEIEKCTVLCANCHRKLHWGGSS